jgi:hypothetical protein
MRELLDDLGFALKVGGVLVALLLLVVFAVSFHDFLTWMGNLS